MRYGVERQHLAGHVAYHGDGYLRQYHHHNHQLRADTAKHQASADAIKNENDNEKEGNPTATATFCAAGSTNAKNQK